jgi:hypothetical protein
MCYSKFLSYLFLFFMPLLSDTLLTRIREYRVSRHINAGDKTAQEALQMIEKAGGLHVLDERDKVIIIGLYNGYIDVASLPLWQVDVTTGRSAHDAAKQMRTVVKRVRHDQYCLNSMCSVLLIRRPIWPSTVWQCPDPLR